MTDTFTPGPWSYDGEDIDSEVAHLVAEEMGLSHDGYEIFSVDADGEVDMPIGTALDEENARLIAAAPDMAIALKKMLAWHNGTNEKKYQPMQSIMEEACAALAKAGVE